MSDLNNLYQELILDHGRHPRHHHALPEPCHCLEGYNPLCGDKLKLFAHINNEQLTELSFEGDGCAISMASASLMTDSLQGKKISEAKALFEKFHALLTSDVEPDPSLKKLCALVGVREFPMRVKCATLAWHTLMGLLANETQAVSTEE